MYGGFSLVFDCTVKNSKPKLVYDQYFLMYDTLENALKIYETIFVLNFILNDKEEVED